MTLPTTTRKAALFYLLTVLLSLLLAFGCMELVLRNISYTNSVDIGGRAQQRWVLRHWGVYNELGFRDFNLKERVQLPQRKLYLLGDSFATGVGVEFDETFYFKAAWAPAANYNAFNLSRPGSSTPDETLTLREFNRITGASAQAVIHQYYINDIENHVVLPKWTAPPWLAAAARHLESAQLLMNYRFNQEWLPRYKDAMRAAYANPDLMRQHLQEVATLHDAIRQQGGTVYLLAFPALSPDDLLQETGRIVQRLRSAFAQTCRPGDKFIDASVSAAKLSASARIVSFLDPHPSAAMHALVAEQVSAALAGTAPGATAPLYERCETLKGTAAAVPPP